MQRVLQNQLSGMHKPNELSSRPISCSTSGVSSNTPDSAASNATPYSTAWSNNDSVFERSDSESCTPNRLSHTTTAHITSSITQCTSSITKCTSSTTAHMTTGASCTIALYTPPADYGDMRDLLLDVTPKSDITQRTPEQEDQIQQLKALAQSKATSGDIDAAILQYRSCLHIYNRTTDSFDSVQTILKEIIKMCKPTQYKHYVGISMLALSDLYVSISALLLAQQWGYYAIEYLREHRYSTIYQHAINQMLWILSETRQYDLMFIYLEMYVGHSLGAGCPEEGQRGRQKTTVLPPSLEWNTAQPSREEQGGPLPPIHLQRRGSQVSQRRSQHVHRLIRF